MISATTLSALTEDVVIEPLKSDLAKNVISACPRLSDKGYKVVKVPERLYNDIYRKTIKSYYLLGHHINEKGASHAIANDGSIDPQLCYLEDDFFTHVHRDPEFVQLHCDFAGIDLVPTHWFGPRVYHHGDVLKEHIDHPTTHIIGSSINVFCEGDQNWPLVFQRDGVYEEVILKPGEMVMFEAVRIPHSRPVKFNGERYFGLFYHFAPKEPDAVLTAEYFSFAKQYEEIM